MLATTKKISFLIFTTVTLVIVLFLQGCGGAQALAELLGEAILQGTIGQLDSDEQWKNLKATRFEKDKKNNRKIVNMSHKQHYINVKGLTPNFSAKNVTVSLSIDDKTAFELVLDNDGENSKIIGNDEKYFVGIGLLKGKEDNYYAGGAWLKAPNMSRTDVTHFGSVIQVKNPYVVPETNIAEKTYEYSGDGVGIYLTKNESATFTASVTLKVTFQPNAELKVAFGISDLKSEEKLLGFNIDGTSKPVKGKYLDYDGSDSETDINFDVSFFGSDINSSNVAGSFNYSAENSRYWGVYFADQK